MRILLCVHHHLDANTGAAGVTLELGERYRALGHEVSYLSFDDLPAALPEPAKQAVFPEAAAALLAARGARREVDVIDATTGDAWLWARLADRGTRPALVTRSHGLEHVFWRSERQEAIASGRPPASRTRLYHGGLRLWEVAASLRASDGCFFCNRSDLEYAVDELGVERRKTSVMINGIPDSLRGLPLHDAPDGTRRVAMIGSWAPRKGTRSATIALNSLLGRNPDIGVVLVGTRRPADEAWAGFAPELRSRVVVVPDYRREELPRLLADSQVLLSASLAEGFSLALPEGMACGLAPVATALPGTKEIVRDGENGLLVPPGDSDAIERALLRVLSDAELLARLRRAARDAAQELTWDAIARRNLDAYERVLARQPVAG